MTQTTRTETTPTRTEAPPAAHRTRAFDIRTIIAVLIGFYGVVLVLMGLFGTSASDLTRAGGMNINLFAGAGMIVVAAAFLLWARARPVVVSDEEDDLVAPEARDDARPVSSAR